MRQAIHILKKDMRGHWYEIATALAVTAAFAFTGVKQAAFWHTGGVSRGMAESLIPFVLPLAWWAVIARVIHAEALPGDRQFWLTRPYRRGSLLGAKALLILICVNVPMLLADAIIVGAYGFHVSSIWPGLLWSQVLLTAVFILPIAALAALTTGLVQLALTLSAVAVTALAWTLAPSTLFQERSPWFGFGWVQTYYAVTIGALIAIVILIWQYALRKTAAARLLAGAAAILLLVGLETISWPTAFWVQSKFSQERFKGSAIEAHFAADRSWAANVLPETDGVRLNIPLTIEGIPNGTTAVGEGLLATIEARDGSTWKAERSPYNVISEGQLTSLRMMLSRSFYDRVKEMPVTIRGSLYLTLLGNEQTTRLAFRNQTEDVPGAGRCTATQSPTGQNYFLLCDSAFRPPKSSVWAEWVNSAIFSAHEPINIRGSYSPFPAEPGINPIDQYSTYRALRGQASAVDVHTMEPLAFVKSDFELKDLRLADFERH